MESKPRIVILGGGFAGLQFTKHIDTDRFDVSIIDRNNFHGFPPLFYQVASSGLDPTSISFPFRRELRKKRNRGTSYHMGEVLSVDVKAQTVQTSFETVAYDYLVIALGTTNNFFGNDTLIQKVYTLKSMDEAIRARNEILMRCESAAIEPDPEVRRRMLSFTVIGGGPAGVEIAGAIGEIKRYILKRDYPEINPDEMSIRLLEGSDRLLRTMSETASRTALKELKNLMVDVKLNQIMKSYTDNVITLADGSEIYSEMVVWTAGVTAVPFEIKGTDAPLRGPGGRFLTDANCRVNGLDNVFAIGDIGLHTSDAFPHGLPQLAQVAIQQGRYVARGINSGFSAPFRYLDKGSMATIGRNRAVADLKNVHLTGYFAWLVWMFIHLVSLLGMRSKINVLLNWVWSYFTYNTALRLLLRGSRYPLRGPIWDKIDLNPNIK